MKEQLLGDYMTLPGNAMTMKKEQAKLLFKDRYTRRGAQGRNIAFYPPKFHLLYCFSFRGVPHVKGTLARAPEALLSGDRKRALRKSFLSHY